MNRLKNAFLTVGKFFAGGWFVYTAYFLVFFTFRPRIYSSMARKNVGNIDVFITIGRYHSYVNQ